MHAYIISDLYRSLNLDRVYPPAFGRRLLELWAAAEEKPTCTLRTQYFTVAILAVALRV